MHENFGEELYVDNARKFYWRDGEAYFAFSKHKDNSLGEVAKKDPKFLRWIISADYSDETKSIVKKALEGEIIKKRKYEDK
jgi:DNA polymerase-3 subunit epsilon